MQKDVGRQYQVMDRPQLCSISKCNGEQNEMESDQNNVLKDAVRSGQVIG